MMTQNPSLRAVARVFPRFFLATLAVLMMVATLTQTGCNPLGSGGGGAEDVIPAPVFTDSGFFVAGKLMQPRLDIDQTTGLPAGALRGEGGEAALRADMTASDLIPAGGYVLYLEKFPQINVVVASDGSYRLGPIPLEAEEDMSDLYGADVGFDLFSDRPLGGSVRWLAAAGSGDTVRGLLAPLLDRIRELEAQTGRQVLAQMTFPIARPSVRVIAVPPEAFGAAGAVTPASLQAALRAGVSPALSEAGKGAVQDIPGPSSVLGAAQAMINAARERFGAEVALGLPALGTVDELRTFGDAGMAPIRIQPNNRVARGKIIDEAGRSLGNLSLRLSGVSFSTDVGGFFQTPVQPRGSKGQVEIVSGPYAQKLPPIDFSFPADQKPLFTFQVYPQGWQDKPPVVSLAAEKYVLAAGDQTIVAAKARDPENQPMRYSWSATPGTIAEYGPMQARYQPGRATGVATITFEATDPAGNKGRTTLNVFIGESVGPFSGTESLAPTIVPGTGLSPAPGAVGVPGNAPLVITFNREVLANSWRTISIYEADTEELVETFAAGNLARVVTNGSVVTIRPSQPLKAGTRFAVTIDAGAFFAPNLSQWFAGLTDPTAWTFTTARAIESLDPAPGPDAIVDPAADLVARFALDVIKGTDDIRILRQDTQELVEAIPVNDERVTLSDKRTLRIRHEPFLHGAALVVEIPASAILLADGSSFGGITGNTWNFRVRAAPTVTKVALADNLTNVTYFPGQVIPIWVTFSDPVTVSGSPRLALNLRPASRAATYVRAVSTTVLLFQLTVQMGETASPLDYTTVDALTLNDGTISSPQGGVAAVLTLPVPGQANSLGATSQARVDSPPVVRMVRSTLANGTYRADAVIPILVEFSKVVRVTGRPQLELNTGSVKRTADYTEGDGTTTLTFTYTVQSGDTSADLDYTSPDALTLNDGTIKGVAGDNAVLTLPAVGSANSLGGQNNLVIDTPDTVSPVVTAVTSTLANGTYGPDTRISILVSFSKPVQVSGFPQLEMETGTVKRKAVYSTGGGSTDLTFTYTVVAGDSSSDLDYTGIGALTLNGGIIRGTNGADAVLTLPAVGSTNSLGGQKDLVIDTVAPAVTVVSSSLADGTYGAGTAIPVKVTFTRAVQVTGTPQLELNTGSVKGKAVYTSGGGSTDLIFTYTVVAGDSSSDLDYTGIGALTLNGGALKGTNGANAILTLPAVGSANSLGGQKDLAIVAPIPVTAIAAIGGTPQTGKTLTAGGLTPANAVVTYRWQVSPDGVAGWTDLDGETASTYVVDPAKSAVGQHVRVVASGKDGFSGTVESAPVQIEAEVVSNLEMVVIPAGTFQFDSTATNLAVITSSYRMSKHPITRGHFLEVVGGKVGTGFTPAGEYPKHPANNVSFFEAIAFCNKLSIKEGLTPVYSVTGVDFSTLVYTGIPTKDWEFDMDTGENVPQTPWVEIAVNWNANGYRLPTMMEWIWGAMGATSDSQPGAMVAGVNRTGYKKGFAGSNGTNSALDYAWLSTNSGGKTQEVGTKLANELGLFDMSGNVSEWVWDWYEYPPDGTLTDYRGPVSRPEYVYFRTRIGSSYFSSVANAGYGIGGRGNGELKFQDNTTGFRVVRKGGS